jgi:hypothetical protein
MLYIFNPREISYRKMFESNLYDQKFRSYESIWQPLDYNLIVYNMATTLQILCKLIQSFL